MSNFTVFEVCSATGGTTTTEKSLVVFNGICTDTRKIQPGNLFVALIGEQFDGHEFIPEAIARGATGILASRQEVKGISDKIVIINVHDTLVALQQLAAFHRSRFCMPIIAVTGSNGKTTTKEMIAAVLSSCWHVHKTQGNFNNEIGLPLTLLGLTAEHQAAVVEMGMRGAGQIRALCSIARPTVAVLTNVGETHIELLGSIENIACAKQELVEAIGNQGAVVLNADDSYVIAMRNKALGKIITYGIDTQADVQAKNIRMESDGIWFECWYCNTMFPIFLPVVGRHNIYNALAAISIGLYFAFDFAAITKGLSTFSPGAMRWEVLRIAEYIIVNDAYNASPLSMKAAIESLQQMSPGRRIAVLGDMLELGDTAIAAHRRIAQQLEQTEVTAVITVGEFARYIAEEAQQRGIIAIACNTHLEAQRALETVLRSGDTILLKGSRGMKMETILEMFR